MTYEVTPDVYCLKDNCEDVRGTCLASDIFSGSNGPRMLLTSYALSQVRAVPSSHGFGLNPQLKVSLNPGDLHIGCSTWVALPMHKQLEGTEHHVQEGLLSA